MKSLSSYFSLLIIILSLSLTGCELVGDIFEAGMWTAVIIIVLVIVLVMWIVRKLGGPRKRF